MIDLASTMISEGRGSELLPSEADPGAPITAYRWVYTHIIIIWSNKYEIELFITSFWDNIYLEGIGFKMQRGSAGPDPARAQSNYVEMYNVSVAAWR